MNFDKYDILSSYFPTTHTLILFDTKSSTIKFYNPSISHPMIICHMMAISSGAACALDWTWPLSAGVRTVPLDFPLGATKATPLKAAAIPTAAPCRGEGISCLKKWWHYMSLVFCGEGWGRR